MAKVYSTLGTAVLSAAAGSIINLYLLRIGGILSTLCLFGLLFWLMGERDSSKRYYLLHAFAFMKGVSLGPLLGYALNVQGGQALIWQAFIGTALVFGTFSAGALIAPSRSYLYLGSFLASGLSLLFYITILLFIWPTSYLYYVTLYFGLLMFVGFIIFDTQKMIERAKSGERDYISDTLELFIDFVGLFVRILILLLDRDGKKNKN
jgi:FtsH-binding integral membrane protein